MIDNTKAFRVKRAVGITFMLALLFFAALPTLWVLIMSFREKAIIFEPFWESPLTVTLDNYLAITRSDFPKALLNSFICAGSATLLAMLVGVPAGFALAMVAADAAYGAASRFCDSLVFALCQCGVN